MYETGGGSNFIYIHTLTSVTMDHYQWQFLHSSDDQEACYRAGMVYGNGNPTLKPTPNAIFRALSFGMAILTAGCASVSSVVEEISYPRDTAVNIGNYHYVINTEKCAEATRISPDGVIDCRATDGTKSASISPVGGFRMGLFKKYFAFAWGSPEHQALLYDFHYKGGKERMAEALVGTIASVYAISSTMKSTNYGSLPTGSGPYYGSASELHSLSVWDAREYSVANWSLQNASLYNLGGGMLVNKNGFVGNQIGDFTYYKNGLTEYKTGSTSYFSNGTRGMQITDSITGYSNGQHCMDIGSIRSCR